MILCRYDPTLNEALADPLVRAVMAADGVDPRQLGAELRALAARLNLSDRSHVTHDEARNLSFASHN
ncbi:MAG TPA: hypothetical protein VK456_05290 [Xanthobacteraceae bacterium]|nr:hypothetical protein [Xanthobacteraceae bacterium]